MRRFNAPFYSAGYLAQVICHYPDELIMSDWIDTLKKSGSEINNLDSAIVIKNINKLSLDMCLSKQKIDFHLLSCDKCRSEYKSKYVNKQNYKTDGKIIVKNKLLYPITDSKDKQSGRKNTCY